MLLVLGRQKLTDLRDVVRCIFDLSVAGDASENPDGECHAYAKVNTILSCRVTTVENMLL